MRRYQRLAIPLSITLMLVISMVPKGKAENLSITVNACDYRIIDGDRGQRIEMEGFGYLMEPGKPMLPTKNFLVLLPPGAQVKSVEVREIGATQLPGTYRIEPSPPILPLVDPSQSSQLVEKMQREWQRNKETVYLSDQVYPQERGELKGSGSLRKYSYASISFYPFNYHPQSGRLIHYSAAHVTINYTLPSPGSLEAQKVEEMKWDTVADERASRLFVNYQQVKELYHPRGACPKTWQQTHDYVIITTSALQSAITTSDFLGWKTSLGYNVRIVLTTDTEITSQPGGDLAEQIRNFLRAYYGPWGIEYVLMVGDYATIPMRYCYPSSNPSGEVPTDHYYADLSDPDTLSWDSDRDGFYGEYGQDTPDLLAEVSVGRVPTNDTARITYTLNKLVTFEQDTGPWKNQALHASAISHFANQNHDGVPFVEGYCLYSIETDLMNGWAISHYSEQEGLSTSVYPWPALSESVFVNDWQNGQYGIVNWYGHGSASGVFRMVWLVDDLDGVPETDGLDVIEYPAFISAWSNLDDDYPSIVFAVSCNVGYPEYEGLGIDLLTKPGFGASAGVISATRPGLASAYWFTNPHGADALCYEFNRYMIAESERVGDAFYYAKFYCNQNHAFDHYLEQRNMFAFNLYGDPALVREGISVGIQTESLVELSRSFLLMQNYPNPFNPVTQIKYALPKDCWVRLKVYNILGQRVATLVDGKQRAGYKAVIWDASSLSSGIYFYRLQAGDFMQTRKMVVLR